MRTARVRVPVTPWGSRLQSRCQFLNGMLAAMLQAWHGKWAEFNCTCCRLGTLPNTAPLAALLQAEHGMGAALWGQTEAGCSNQGQGPGYILTFFTACTATGWAWRGSCISRTVGSRLP